MIYGIDLGTTNSLIGCNNHLISRLVSSRVDTEKRITVSKDTVGDAIKASYKVNMGLGKTGQDAIDASSIVLQSLKDIVLKETGDTVKDVVISVPAYFSTNQRTAVQKAAEKVGLNLVRVINEPTAAAIHICGTKDINRGIYAIYDLGGGTFDCTLIDSRSGKYQVIGTDGKILGGDDLDNAIAKAVITKAKVPMYARSSVNVAALLVECNKWKLLMQSIYDLTPNNDDYTVPIALPEFMQQSSTYVDLTLGDYKQFVVDTFKSTVTMMAGLIDRYINDATTVDIIFVGGSTHCGFLRDYVTKNIGISYGSIRLDKEPDFTVALGCVEYATLLDNDSNDIVFSDVTKQLSVEEDDGTAIVIIPANTVIPVTKTRLLTNKNLTQQLNVKLYQGNNVLECANEYIGSILYDFPSVMEPYEGNVEATITVDSDGIIHLTVEDIVHFGERKTIELKGY